MTLLANTRVTVFQKMPDGSFQNRGTGVTDANGEYVVADLETGTYTLKFEQQAFSSGGVDYPAGFWRTTYYGNRTSLETADLFGLGSNEVYTVDFTMTRATRINGTIDGA